MDKNKQNCKWHGYISRVFALKLIVQAGRHTRAREHPTKTTTFQNLLRLLFLFLAVFVVFTIWTGTKWNGIESNRLYYWRKFVLEGNTVYCNESWAKWTSYLECENASLAFTSYKTNVSREEMASSEYFSARHKFHTFFPFEKNHIVK